MTPRQKAAAQLQDRLARDRLKRMSPADLAATTANDLTRSFGLRPDDAERLLRAFQGR